MALPAQSVTALQDEQTVDAFDRLFVQEYRRVVNIAFRILNDTQEAEDVAQEAFISFQGKHDAEAPYAPAWLHRAASHLALNAIRSRKRRDRRERDEGVIRDRSGADSMAVDPAESLDAQEQRQQVREVLRRLPKRSAVVLALRYSGLSYAEVAEALGCRIGQVGTLLRRAEEAFRKELDRETP